MANGYSRFRQSMETNRLKANSLFVAWRPPMPDQTGWRPVGRLEHDGGLYRFWYTHGARKPGFRPFAHSQRGGETNKKARQIRAEMPLAATISEALPIAATDHPVPPRGVEPLSSD